MSHTIDGFNFDSPPEKSQVIALAQHHRKLLEEAVFHQEIHLGDYCLEQRKRVYDYTRTLDPAEKVEFYRYYDGELKRMADDDDLHPPHAEAGVSYFAIGITFVIIASVLYFGFVRSLTG